MRLFIFLAFLLVHYADAVHYQEIYITLNISECHQNCCFTLSQFAEEYKSNNSDACASDTDIISLVFQPGNHSLDKELRLPAANNILMHGSTQGPGTVFIECTGQLGMFNISYAMVVSVCGLHFIGCSNNEVRYVDMFTVDNTTFEGVEGGGTALWLTKVKDTSIVGSDFLYNGLQQSYPEQNDSKVVGGALNIILSSNVSIDSSNFICNEAEVAGVIFIQNSSLSITQSNFSYNKANDSGGVIVSSDSSISIDKSHFSTNSADYGRVVQALNDSMHIMNNDTFTGNFSRCGGVINATYESSFTITRSSFSDNTAYCGGVIAVGLHASINVTKSTFSNNNAHDGGVIAVMRIHPNFTSNSSINITNSNFIYNHATRRGGVIYVDYESFKSSTGLNISGNTFTNNSAMFGGVLDTYGGNYVITGNTIANNTGGVLCNYLGSFKFADCHFTGNIGQNYRGILFVFECSIHVTDCTFDHNLGSLYTFSSILIFRGETKFENGVEQASDSNNISGIHNEGGAITSFHSTVIFTESSTLSYNRARDGGAIFASESTIVVYGEMTVACNTAEDNSGGGISLRQSDLEIKGTCNVSSNNATRGGGIHATSSSISVHQPGVLKFTNNSAVNGSGMYLEINSKLYVLRRRPRRYIKEDLLAFEGNNASYAGGAVYVADDTSSGSCLQNIECFIQTLAVYPDESKHRKNISIHFLDNMATKQGSTIFGGLLDRCIPSPFTETYHVNDTINKESNDKYNSSVTYLQNISNVELDSISSLPVRVCFCTDEGESDCTYQPQPIKVKKGEAFTVSLVAVDQVNHSLAASITGSLASSNSGLGKGQQIQPVSNSCTNLTYNIFSSRNEILKLYADGPCGSSNRSVRKLEVDFIDCTCPIGFMPSSSDKNATECMCVCDEALFDYVTDCNSTTMSLHKKKSLNSWINYVNYSNSNLDDYQYITFSNCPFDYCNPGVSINLNLPNGADAQCNNNRRGVLCGACQKNFSLSLGSSHCLPCPKTWPLELVAVLLAAALAGILLVIALLVLNMTVAVGLINGFIFYANIVAANNAIFFPSSKPSFPTVFVAWLNLEIGFDACFLNGLDANTKAWLQFVFPVYMIVLVIVVIIASEYSPRFAALIGKRDPVATLATLILLSYAKLLSTSITGLLFATLHYPDGERTVWLPDGNVNYFKGKHALLAIMALLILTVIGIPFTLLIFLWQWLVSLPKWKALEWIRNTKLDAFISTYHEPYNVKYRYWPGLLLLVRVILYITASVTVSANPQALVLMTILLVGAIVLHKAVVGVRVHRKSYVDILETVTLFNLLALAAFSLYHFQINKIKQTAVAYISTIITFSLLVGVIGYHVFILIKKSNRFQKKANEYPLAAVKLEVTLSTLEIPSPPSESGSDDLKAEERNTIITETFTDEL